VTQENQGENLLREGQDLREKADPVKSIDVFNHALEVYAKEGNFERFAHTLLDMALAYQQLSQANNNSREFVRLCESSAAAMLKIVEERGLESKKSEAYFINGKAKSLLAEYRLAADYYRKAIDYIAPEKQAQKGDWQTNLGKAVYLSGQREKGRQMILDGIEQVKNHAADAGEYEINVWVSGGYLRLSEVLRSDDEEAAAEYLSEAEKIIKSDPKQIVRKNFKKTGVTGL
jgi:tetratricopeptide (TPR) repeat protein